jgi:hypothetical protein
MPSLVFRILYRQPSYNFIPKYVTLDRRVGDLLEVTVASNLLMCETSNLLTGETNSQRTVSFSIEKFRLCICKSALVRYIYLLVAILTPLFSTFNLNFVSLLILKVMIG